MFLVRVIVFPLFVRARASSRPSAPLSRSLSFARIYSACPALFCGGLRPLCVRVRARALFYARVFVKDRRITVENGLTFTAWLELNNFLCPAFVTGPKDFFNAR